MVARPLLSTRSHVLGISRELRDVKNCQEAKMVHYPLKTDQKKNHFFLPNKFTENGNGIIMKLKVVLESYELCGKFERLYRTIFESLFVDYQGSLAMSGGEF